MKSLKDIRAQIDEVLTKKDPAAKWIHDFVHSDNPQFAGKSMAKRRQMALAAYYSKKNEAAFVSPSMSTDIKGDLEEAFLSKKEEDDLDNLSSDDFVKKYGHAKHAHRKSHATRSADIEKFTESQEEDDRQAAEHNQKELEQQQQELEAKKKKEKVKEEVELEEGKKGLWANIHAKRKRIAAGSGERMRKPGSKGAPSDQDLKNSQEQVGESAGLSHALAQVGKDKWHIYDTKTQKVHSTYNNKKVAMKKYGELNDKHAGYDTPGGIIKGKYGVRKEEVDLTEDIKKEYEGLKKHDIKTLRGMIKQQHRIIDTSEFRTKEHAISHILNNKHGNKRVMAALGEELEQIDEISKETVGNYLQGVVKQQAATKKSDTGNYEKLPAKRQQGVSNAFKRLLKKEEVEQIDEISKHTLVNYINKASHDAASGAYAGKDYISHSHQHTAAGDWEASKKKHDMATKEFNRANKRLKNIPKATVKLARKKTFEELVQGLEESRGHKVIATFLKNREVAQRAFTGQNKPTEKKPEPEKKEVKEGFDDYHEIAKELVKRHGKNVDTGHINDLAGERDSHRGLDHSEVMHHVNKLLNAKKEVKEGEVYDEKWKKFKKIKEGVSMLNFNDFLKEAWQEGAGKARMQEKLVGNQHKLDKNKNGKLDSDDFKKLRGESKKCMDEDDVDESGLRMAAHAAHKSGKKEFEFKGKTYPVKVQKEEVEHIDEISKDTLASYIPKAAKSSRIHGMISKDYANAAERKRNPGLKSALDRLSKKYKSKAWKREDGIATAVKKLTKEDVQIDEGKMKDIYTSMMHHADKKGYSSHKQFTPADYDAVGKEHGISGKDLAVIAGHKTAHQIANEAVDTVKKDASGKVKSWSHEGDWKKSTANKEGSGKAANLAGQALKKTKELSKEEVEQVSEDNHVMSYVNATLAVMDEGKLDDLRDAQKLRAANKSAYDKDYKADTSHPHITTHKGTSYGGQAQKDDEGDEKPEVEKEKRGRGRPHGSKSGARQKGNGREDGGIPVHSLHLPNRNK